MSGRAFKAEYRLPPLRFPTPPPPVEFYEPLTSPVQRAGGDSLFTNNRHDGGQPHDTTPKRTAYNTSNSGSAHHDHVMVGQAPFSFDTRLERPPKHPRSSDAFSPPQGSPIDTLANAASSLAPSPIFAPPSRRPSQAPISPSTVSFFPPIGQTPHHILPGGHITARSERPVKRARSEFFPSSPQNGQHASRPATSHHPAQAWSYNVEQMIDNGMRFNPGPSASNAHSFHRHRASQQDAELLIFFSTAAQTSSNTSNGSTAASRPSVQPTQTDLTVQHTTLPADTTSPQWLSQPSDGNIELKEPQPFQPTETEPMTDVSYGPVADEPAVQTRTPPEEAVPSALPLEIAVDEQSEPKKLKKHQGWPKGKPRGPRASGNGAKKKKTLNKAANADEKALAGIPDQLQSPQSLPADTTDANVTSENVPMHDLGVTAAEAPPRNRRCSFSGLAGPALAPAEPSSPFQRAQSVPPKGNVGAEITWTPRVEETKDAPQDKAEKTAEVTVCAGCSFTSSTAFTGDSQQWISCDGCKEWFHFACAGFQTLREVRDVDKYFCKACRPVHGQTTFVRKSKRAHAPVDYAGLHEGVLRTSDENPEHHYLKPIKDGTLQFDEESFARLPPELVTEEFLAKINGFREPVVIPAALNPRPKLLGTDIDVASTIGSANSQTPEHNLDAFEYEYVPDDGQDKLDMVIPQGLTVRRVAAMYGPEEKVEVIDVKSQEGEDKRWNMAKWADYYEQEGEKVVRNVISLEVSQSKMGRLIRRPKAVRDMDLQDWVWPEEDKHNAPKVQFYCLMSVADCYTDFHIDFGGSSVYYHIVKGKKTFFFIPPTKQNLKKYEDWCLSPAQNWTFLPHQVKECFRVDLSEGDTMLIPSGWIHAVWTPENSLVIGGNFLTRLHFDMQIRIAEVEKKTKVARKFRYPHFQKVNWFAMLKYIEEDPLPNSVAQLLHEGKQFVRALPIWCEPNKFGHNSDLGPENYNARYYSKAELEGLPDLINYIWRTVMISLGRVEGITVETKNAVTRSIPKGRGDPLTLVRTFAMWVAWKRGNEDIPDWARKDALLPEASDSKEKKLSNAQLKRLEQKDWADAMRAARERQPGRSRGAKPLINGAPSINGAQTAFLQPVNEASMHLSTPKTSQLGPKRIACDACRKRRIRCKHKDELADGKGGPPSSLAIPHSGAIQSVTSDMPTFPAPPAEPVKRRYSEVGTASSMLHPGNMSTDSNVYVNGRSSDFGTETANNKPGRVKACLDCRKSKRRCIHDENGNIDPVKASEAPVPRGSASKKRRISEGDPTSTERKAKKENLSNGTLSNRDDFKIKGLAAAVSNNISPSAFMHRQNKSPELQDSITVYSPLKAADESADNDMMLVDDSTYHSGYENGQSVIDPELPQSDAVMASIEHNVDTHMGDLDQQQWTGGDSEASSVRHCSLFSTPKPTVPPSNGVGVRLSSPLEKTPVQNRIPVDPALKDPPTRPRAQGHGTSAHKPSNTPRPRSRKASTPKSGGLNKPRRDSRDSINVLTRASPLMDADEAYALRLAMEFSHASFSLRRRS